MKIIFANEKEFEYIRAFAVEKDHYNGETRQSIEIHLPVAQTSYEEISAIVNDADIIKSFILSGDAPVDEYGNTGIAPTNLYEGYVYGDKITVEKGILIFKKYKASAAEMENAELKAAAAEMLTAEQMAAAITEGVNSI